MGQTNSKFIKIFVYSIFSVIWATPSLAEPQRIFSPVLADIFQEGTGKEVRIESKEEKEFIVFDPKVGRNVTIKKEVTVPRYKSVPSKAESVTFALYDKNPGVCFKNAMPSGRKEYYELCVSFKTLQQAESFVKKVLLNPNAEVSFSIYDLKESGSWSFLRNAGEGMTEFFPRWDIDGYYLKPEDIQIKSKDSSKVAALSSFLSDPKMFDSLEKLEPEAAQVTVEHQAKEAMGE